jgi:hypothetical protein
MKQFYFFLLIFAASIGVSAQPNFSWARSVGAASASIGPNGITVDGLGNVITVGNFTGTCDFDPGPSTFTMSANGVNNDIFVCKFNQSGNFIWAFRIGAACTDYGYAICSDASGNLYITGSFCGTVDFDPGPGTYTMNAAGTEYYVCKFDPNGNILWASQSIGVQSEIGYGVALDNSGNVVTVGIFNGTADFDPGPGTYTLTSLNSSYDVFICKYNSTGALQWAGKVGGTAHDYGYSIATDPSGNILITGQFAATPDFDPGPGSYTIASLGGGYDIFVEKLSSGGNFVWAKSMASTANESGIAVKADASGNVITACNSYSVVDFDPGPSTYTLPIAGNNDSYVSKLDALGNFVWAVQTGGPVSDQGNALFVDNQGNIFVDGWFGNTVDFDPGPGSFTMTSSGSNDVFIQKLDQNGNFSWAIKSGGSGNDVSMAIFTDVYGAIYSAGNFQSSVDFDPGPGTFSLTSIGNSDAYFQKLVNCTLTPAQPSVIAGATVVCANAGILVYSLSPVGGASAYSWQVPSGWTGSSNTGTINAIPGTSGIFSVAATNSCGPGPYQTLSVTVNAIPNVVASGPASVCTNSYSCLSASGAVSYTWTGPCGFTSNSVSPCVTLFSNCACGFSLTGQDANGCINTATLCITTVPLPTVIVAPKIATICVGQSQVITVNGAATYSWLPTMQSGSAIVASPTVYTEYQVTGYDNKGCSGKDTAFVFVDLCTNVKSSETSKGKLFFYPNPVKNQMLITGLSDVSSELTIYNSSGCIVHREKCNGGEKKINFEGFSPGIYLIRIKAENNESTLRVLKE